MPKKSGPVERKVHDQLRKERNILNNQNLSLRNENATLRTDLLHLRDARDRLTTRAEKVEDGLEASEAAGKKGKEALLEAQTKLAAAEKELADRIEAHEKSEAKIKRELAIAQAEIKARERQVIALTRALILATENGRWFSNMTPEEKAELPVTLPVEEWTFKGLGGGWMRSQWTENPGELALAYQPE
jgi:cell division septum initiation protein DivIVA